MAQVLTRHWAVSVALVVVWWLLHDAFVGAIPLPLESYAAKIGWDLKGIWGWIETPIFWGGLALIAVRHLKRGARGKITGNIRLALITGILLWIESGVVATLSWMGTWLNFPLDWSLFVKFAGMVVFWYPFSKAVGKHLTIPMKGIQERLVLLAKAYTALFSIFGAITWLGGWIKEGVLLTVHGGQRFIDAPNSRGEVYDNWLFGAVDALQGHQSWIPLLAFGAIVVFGKKNRRRVRDFALLFLFYSLLVALLQAGFFLNWAEGLIFHSILRVMQPQAFLMIISGVCAGSVAYMLFNHVPLAWSKLGRRASLVLIVLVASVTGVVGRLQNMGEPDAACLLGFQATVTVIGGFGLLLFLYWWLLGVKTPQPEAKTA